MDDYDDGEDSDGDGFSDDEATTNNNDHGSNSPQANSRATAAAAHQLAIASVLCNSDSPLLLGPDWNGTFSTNSADGAYPSLNRSCTFTMQAMPSSANSSSGGNGRPTPYVVALTFSTPIQLVCGTDYLTLYDGPDATAPILAKICGNIWKERIPTFYSTGPMLTAVFSSQESSPGSFGFTAVWYSIETAGYKDFTPRSQHAMAYDPVKDMVYISGGTSLRNPFLGDLLTYNFATNKWSKITPSRNPDPRYGHFAFMHDDALYIYGGISIIGALSDMWKFDGKTWLPQVAINPEKLPDLWYALAPRIDPLTATPVSYWNVTDSPTLNTTTLDADDGDSDQVQNSTAQYLPAVMYDPLTTIWTPAGVIGEDTVVMYGGMRPYGPGVNEREQSCFASSFAIYDLSCQNWTSYDVSELDGVLKGRVNHTMVIRPPGAPGGSKTAYTAYIFGGFDGMDRADMLNASMTIPTASPSAINSCRDKAKSSEILAGNSNDFPRMGTIQDLLRQRPDLRAQGQSLENCPSRTSLDLTVPYSGTIESGQELSFRIYVDEDDLNIQYEIRTLPTSALEFKSLNVWEGYMNMYWRADHVLTDNSWVATADPSAPDPSALDLPAVSSNMSDSPVITAGGSLNTSELMNRWTKYSGLDSNPFTSAIRNDTSYIYFLASDPRRFAGYHVFSLTNHNPSSLSFSVTVTLLNHPTAVDKTPGARFNMATLGFFMLGFIFAVALLVFMARKIRQLIEDRDASQRSAEMQLLVDEEDDRRRNNRGGLNGRMALIQMDGSMLLKKPLYRIVVGVQDMGKEVFGISGSNLRHRNVRGSDDSSGAGGGLKDQCRLDFRSKGAVMAPELPGSMSHPTAVQSSAEAQDPASSPREKRSRVRSDFIRDIGSAPLPLTAAEESMMEKEAGALSGSSSWLGNTRKLSASTPDLVNVVGANLSSEDRPKTVAATQEALWTKSTPSLVRQGSQGEQQKDRSNQDNNVTPQRPTLGETGLQRGWSLRSLGRNSSLTRSFSHRSKTATTAEEREGLTSQNCILEEDPVGNGSGGGVSERGSFD
ncbi:Multiple epidermal growth factor-like domains protein 8, partial [Mortierella sp. AD032]